MKTAERSGTRAHAARSMVVTGIAQAYRVTLGFVSGILLARLLSPGDFGLIAMISTCVSFVALVQDLGLNQATIQREQISHSQMSAMFWLSLGFSILMALAFAASAPLAAWFFGDSRLIPLAIAFAFLIALDGGQSQQFGKLNRDLRFKALAALDAVGATASAAVSVTIAWLTASYWALFAASLASTLVGFVCIWIVSSFRPGRPSFEGNFKEIVGFGSAISGFNIVNYFARNADNLLIGRFYGGEQLGFYDRAYRLLLFPLSQIQAPLGRVMLPLLARLQSDPERYCKAYTDCVSLLMMVSQPGLVFVIVFADDVFLILLGPHWVPAAPIFRWLGVCGVHQVMASTLGWLFLSQGRGGEFFKIGLFNAVSTIASFIIGLPWGPVGVAVAYTIANYVVVFPASWWQSGHRGPVRARDLVVTTLPHTTASVAAGVVLTGVAIYVQAPGMVTCLGLAALSYAVYGCVMLAFPRKRLILFQNIRTFAGILAHCLV